MRRSTQDMKPNYGSCKRQTDQRYLQFTPLWGRRASPEPDLHQNQEIPAVGLLGCVFFFNPTTTGETLCNKTLSSDPSSVSSLLTSTSLPTSLLTLSSHAGEFGVNPLLLSSDLWDLQFRYSSGLLCTSQHPSAV